MSVPVRIVALPESRVVLGVGERGIEDAMSGVESEPAGNSDVRHDPSREKKLRRHTTATAEQNYRNEEGF